jgi:LysM repeat protein
MRKIAYLAVAFAVVTTTSIGTHTALVSAQQAKTEKVAQEQDDKKAKEQKAEEKRQAEAKAAEAKAKEAPKPVMVTVAAGDSLSKIASSNNTTWVRIFNANESIVNPDIINPGQEVRIPTAEEQLADRPLPQAPAPAPAPAATAYRATTQTAKPRAAAAASYPVSGNAAKAFIYAKESGNNPNATNPNGCYGIGQDCNGVLRDMCGANYACQDQYFTNYAMGRYGSWEAAYAFWQNNHWW